VLKRFLCQAERVHSSKTARIAANR
jgi:hypothetical protein